MKGNNLWKTFALALIVLAALVGLFYLPHMKIGDKDLRRVNILSDVQRRDADGKIIAEVKADSIDGIVEAKMDTTAVAVRHIAYVDSVPEGMTAIEDFADVNGVNREMDKFYRALSHSSERPVRIAYYGDSYVEGDILTMDLRGLLQGEYGGRGVGFVEINCVSADFRQTAATKRSGWSCYYANERKRGFKENLQGVAGSYFIPSDKAVYEIRGSKSAYKSLLDTVEVATVFFTPGAGLNIGCAMNGGDYSSVFSNGMAMEEEYYDETDSAYDSSEVADSTAGDSVAKPVRKAAEHQQTGAGNVMAKSVTGRIGKLSLSVTGGKSSRFYGVALDGRKGVSLDNFSMRGSGGQFIENIPIETLKSFASVRPYDLVILHYGLNVAAPKQKDYSAYIRKMGNVIEHLKEAYPGASILVVGMADRDAKGPDGVMHTMDGVRELVTFERKMASDQHVAFWNLYEAMGGDGSLARMQAKKQANRDFTHINFAGGKHLAGLLFDALVVGKENYDKRTAN